MKKVSAGRMIESNQIVKEPESSCIPAIAFWLLFADLCSQQFFRSALDLVLQKLEAMIRKIISGMFFEVESQKVAKPFFVFWRQNLFGCSQKIIVADGNQGARVIREGLIGDQVVASCVVK